ncbi:hypothetical protein Rs2_51390 [Raphanus sativus]|nr:hypothetical protein Rs2_51390 [Raphanus sativus]
MVATIWIQAFTGTNFDFSTYSSDLKSVLGISQVQLNYLADDLDFMLTTDPWRSYKRTSLDFYGQLIQTPSTMLSIAAASASACSPPPPPPVLAFKRALFAIYTSSLTFLGDSLKPSPRLAKERAREEVRQATSAGMKEQEAINFLEKKMKENPAFTYDETVQEHMNLQDLILHKL